MPQCPGLTSPSNCPSLPTHNSRPTCRTSLPISFVNIDMSLYRIIYPPRLSRRCRTKRSARHCGTTSGPSPTSAEIGKSRHVNARSLQKASPSTTTPRPCRPQPAEVSGHKRILDEFEQVFDKERQLHRQQVEQDPRLTHQAGQAHHPLCRRITSSTT